MRLLPYARPYGWHFAAVLALVVVFNTSAVLQPYLVKVSIDSHIARGDAAGLKEVALAYVGVVLMGGVANYLQMIVLQKAGQSVIRQIRADLFDHIERQSMSFFDHNAIGRLVTNVSSDTETVSQFFTQFFLSLVRDGLSIVMIVIAMFELDARIALYCMVVIPVIFAISAFFRTRLRRAYQETRTRLSNIVAFLAENLAGIRIIQIFHQEARQAHRFGALNDSHRQANIRAYGISVMFNRSLEMLGNMAVAAMVLIGGRAVLGHTMLFGTLYAFISYIRQFFQPINSITQQWNNLQSSMVAAERIGRVFQVEPEITDPPDPL
ncbi:MAG: ABC transporter ATP-binding protein, partial [Alicyclobacillus sp.]|nr:ABC transporter ATP-binding protein [Alicyclobacillus sp.]